MKMLQQCWDRRNLLKYLIISKLKLGKKDLLLGYIWWILDPFLLMGVYWLFISVILQRGEPNYPLFIICGLIPFRAMSITVSQSVTSVSSKFSLINQISFPRLFLPLADVLSNHIKLFIGFAVVVFWAMLYDVYPGLITLLVLIPFIIQLIMAMGIALFISIFGVFFPDLRNVVQFIIRIWLYGSPVLYSIDRVPEKFKSIFLLNPMAAIVTMYRDIFMFHSIPKLSHIAIAGSEAVVLLFLGYFIFTRLESRILKVL